MRFILIWSILIGIAIASEGANEDINQPEVSEKPIQLIHVLNPGEREYLSPNLIGVQNIAMTFLPLNLNFINIIDAFREIVNGVRYEIILNAVDSTSEKVCRLVILEKPWLRTLWGDKVRELQYSNCTDGGNSVYDNNKESATNNYISIENTRNELSASEMAVLESQIETTFVPPISTTNDYDINESTTPTNELKDDEKNWVDEFFGMRTNDDKSSNSALEDDVHIETKRQADNTLIRSKRNVKTNFDDETVNPTTISDNLHQIEILFNKFELKFKRKYSNSTERQNRLRIFTENIKKIEELNENERGSAKYGITEFTDYTPEEFNFYKGLLSSKRSRDFKNKAEIPNVEIPKDFDWREKGVITKVKNQGMCGSCWAFSVTGNIEGLHAIRTGKMEEYSEQELLDCDTVDSACNGGLPDDAFEAIKNIGGLELENDYPYAARKQKCRFNSTKVHVKVKGFVDISKNETAMAQWLIKNGPVSIGINANAMQFYRGGVSHPWKPLCSHKNLDHGVLIVGFGVSEYPSFKKILPYWIIKNSWGSKWGEQGYYRVYRGDNTCGVSEMVSSAVLDDL